MSERQKDMRVKYVGEVIFRTDILPKFQFDLFYVSSKKKHELMAWISKMTLEYEFFDPFGDGTYAMLFFKDLKDATMFRLAWC